jgi:hypothetical protein
MPYDPSRMAAVMQRMQTNRDRAGAAGTERMQKFEERMAMRDQMPGMVAPPRPAMPMPPAAPQVPPMTMRPAVMPQVNPVMRPAVMPGMQAPAMPPGQMAAMGVAPAGSMRPVTTAPTQNTMLPNSPYRGRL